MIEGDTDYIRIQDTGNPEENGWIQGLSDPDLTYPTDLEIDPVDPVSVDPEEILPSGVELGVNAPNPFNPRTTITFALERDGWAEVGVYELAGKRVVVLADQIFTGGEHSLLWNGRDAQGRAMPSGTYLVRLETASSVEARKVMLVR